MSVIDEILGPASFEYIRAQLGLILVNELAYQAANGYQDVYAADVYGERFVPFNQSEFPAVNISLLQIPFDGQTFEQVDGTNRFCIDCYTKGVSTESYDGDAFAQKEMHKLVAVVMKIISHSKYVRLGFDPPFIQYRRIMDLQFSEPEKQDSFSVARGRIILEVSAVEMAGVYMPGPLTELLTQVKLHSTEKGYQYFGSGAGVYAPAVQVVTSGLANITELLDEPGTFELIRDQVATILADELGNQAAMGYEDVLAARVYGERMFRFNLSETPAVNVCLAGVPMDGHSFEQMEGNILIFIDCFVTAKTTDAWDGDAKSQMEMQKLVACCLYILHHSKFVRLGFAPPFIQHRGVTDIKFADPVRKDSFSVAKGRITLEVSAVELAGVSVPGPLNEYRTQVKLYATEKGYLYFGTQPEPPVEGIFDETFDPSFE